MGEFICLGFFNCFPLKISAKNTSSLNKIVKPIEFMFCLEQTHNTRLTAVT